MINQKGITPLLILILSAVILGIVAIGFILFITAKPQPPKAKVKLPPLEVYQSTAQSKAGSPECPELDYTGCDNTGDFMTWKDDGVR